MAKPSERLLDQFTQMVPEKWLQTSYRSPKVAVRDCVLCEESHACFTFSDNEGYGIESLCVRCLRVAVNLIENACEKKDDV